jgi:hypothetical protein
MILFKVLTKKFVRDGDSQFQNFFVNFHNFLHCSLWDYHSRVRLSQVLCKTGSENAHGCTQTAENIFGFNFRVIPQKWWWNFQLHRDYHRWWNLGFNKTRQKIETNITGDETWVSIKQGKKLKRMLSATKLMATVFWDRKGVLMVEFIQGTTVT